MTVRLQRPNVHSKMARPKRERGIGRNDESRVAAGGGSAGGAGCAELYLADLAATGRLAEALARLARVGDVLALAGPLGVGKTAFARAFIRALGGEEEVPSPTFTLVQLYELGTLTLYHFDLYRFERPEEAYELGIEGLSRRG